METKPPLTKSDNRVSKLVPLVVETNSVALKEKKKEEKMSLDDNGRENLCCVAFWLLEELKNHLLDRKTIKREPMVTVFNSLVTTEPLIKHRHVFYININDDHCFVFPENEIQLLFFTSKQLYKYIKHTHQKTNLNLLYSTHCSRYLGTQYL